LPLKTLVVALLRGYFSFSQFFPPLGELKFLISTIRSSAYTVFSVGAIKSQPTMEAPVNRNPQAAVLSVNSNSDTDTANKTALLEKFTSLMGTKSQEANSVTSSRLKDMARLLLSSTGDDQVVLVVPSLDLRLTEGGEHEKNELLPQMGEHAAPSDTDGANASSDSAADSSTDSTTRPSMDASVLTLASDKMEFLEPMAATNIGKQTSWTRSTLSYASPAVSTNVTDSFTTLLNSRLRAWTLILLRHSLSTGSVESRSKLLSMLGAAIHVDSSESKYRTLPLPDAAKGAKPKDSDIILPLLFEISLHISIQSKPEKVILRAPGTISGTFGSRFSLGALRCFLLTLLSLTIFAQLYLIMKVMMR
jgi:hypothetical protein